MGHRLREPLCRVLRHVGAHSLQEKGDQGLMFMDKWEFVFWLLIAGNVGLGVGVWATALVTDNPLETIGKLLNFLDG